MAPRKSIAKKPTGRLLGNTFDEWYKLGLKNGIMAVIDRWGDPLIYRKQQSKAELLAIAWAALRTFNPMPLPTEVQALISQSHPPTQQPAPRIVVHPPGAAGPADAAGTAGTPIVVDDVPATGPSSGLVSSGVSSADNTPSKPEPPKKPAAGLLSPDTTPLKTPLTSEKPLENPPSGSTMGEPGVSASKSRDRTTLFTINKRAQDPQSTDGLNITGANFQDQLAGLILRYSHRVPTPSVGGTQDPLPQRNARDLRAIVRSQQLENAFDNEHDPRISSFRLSFSNFAEGDYQAAMYDRDYRVRGRGPVWHANSCALDTVIVAAQLLGIGRIQNDTGTIPRDEWLEQLDPFPSVCVQIFSEPWEIFTEAESIRRRDTFLRYAIRESEDWGASAKLRPHGMFQSSSSLWKACTQMADQFKYREFRRNYCTACDQQTRLWPEPATGRPLVGTLAQHITFTQLGADESTKITTFNMEDMLQRHFGAPASLRNHTNCQGANSGSTSLRAGRRVISPEGLPARLVVEPSFEFRNIPGATNDRITFTYATVEGNMVSTDGQPPQWQQSGVHERTVSYRWMGGIYQRNKHFRVYWQDSKFASSNGNVKVYDGMLFGGAIIGEFPPIKAGHKVPAAWADGADVLFYERINDDDSDAVIASAQTYVADVLAGRGKYDNHVVEQPGPQTDPPKPAKEQHQQGKSNGSAGKKRSADDAGLEEKPTPGKKPRPETADLIAKSKKTVASPGLKPEKPLTPKGKSRKTLGSSGVKPPKKPLVSPGVKPKNPLSTSKVKPKNPLTAGLDEKAPISTLDTRRKRVRKPRTDEDSDPDR
ncbi:hypothetical protein MMC11_004599 [Xylographa trunciseda]|nr:hypothetical protein [Xylographa trunciseda]